MKTNKVKMVYEGKAQEITHGIQFQTEDCTVCGLALDCQMHLDGFEVSEENTTNSINCKDCIKAIRYYKNFQVEF